MKRNVGLAGLTIRPLQKLSINLDYEGASDRSELLPHQPVQLSEGPGAGALSGDASLWFQANFRFLDNQNPTSGINYDFRSRDNSLAVYWTPGGGKHVSVMAEYDRYTLSSSINYLLLPFYTPTVGIYRDNAHTASSTVDIVLPAISRATRRSCPPAVRCSFRRVRGPRATISRWDACRCRSTRTYNGTPSGDGTATASRCTCMKASGRIPS